VPNQASEPLCGGRAHHGRQRPLRPLAGALMDLRPSSGLRSEQFQLSEDGALSLRPQPAASLAGTGSWAALPAPWCWRFATPARQGPGTLTAPRCHLPTGRVVKLESSKPGGEVRLARARCCGEWVSQEQLGELQSPSSQGLVAVEAMAAEARRERPGIRIAAPSASPRCPLTQPFHCRVRPPWSNRAKTRGIGRASPWPLAADGAEGGGQLRQFRQRR